MNRSHPFSDYMIVPVDIKDYLNVRSEAVLFDVRSEKEFAEGHIPDAINIPMLTNEQRHKVGLVYKQMGREAAVFKGLELSGPELKNRLKTALKYNGEKAVYIHCWRGGMRSEFFAFILHFYGLKVHVINGGYKAFRKYAQEQFLVPIPALNILAGKTGSAKTLLLKKLADAGENVIDLEELAQHRGSSFGALAFAGQPTQEQFENQLALCLAEKITSARIWIEDEGRTIGSKVIPEGLWGQMRSASRLLIDRSFEERLEHITSDYGAFSVDALRESFIRIGKRLGPQHLKKALEYLSEGKIKDAFTIALTYYDRSYDYLLAQHDPQNISIFNGTGKSYDQIVTELIELKHD